MKKIIDLRSDTVTRPTADMRIAMAEAEVGDDVYGEDPTINRLQEIAAGMMGKEAALFVPSGTMGNLIAVLTHCGRGEEAIMGYQGHTFIHEAGGIAALGGVHPYPIPNQNDGSLSIQKVQEAIRSIDVHHPLSKLIILENTQNQCGGLPLGVQYTDELGKLAKEHALLLHIDGARIFNAASALKVSPQKLVEPADSITFCLSKGLCAPVGSVLCGSKEFINKATHIRKQLGGGMRQAGILAAAGIIALEKMTVRLCDDHQRAAELADGLRSLPYLHLDNGSPATNMIFAEIDLHDPFDAWTLAEKLASLQIKIGCINSHRIRLVTHHDIHDEDLPLIIQQFETTLNAAV